LKLFIVGVRRKSSGSKFQTAGPAYEKVRSANFDVPLRNYSLTDDYRHAGVGVLANYLLVPCWRDDIKDYIVMHIAWTSDILD